MQICLNLRDGNRMAEFNSFLSSSRQRVLQRLLSANNQISFEDAEDIVQESSMVLLENLEKGKVKTLDANYFYKICRNQATHFLRTKQSEVTCEEEFPDVLDFDDESHSKRLREEKLELILGELSESEQQILRLFYWEGKSLNEIAKMMGYRSEDSAKTLKSRVFNKLKAAMLEPDRSNVA